jgi:hypothetical protein
VIRHEVLVGYALVAYAHKHGYLAGGGYRIDYDAIVKDLGGEIRCSKDEAVEMATKAMLTMSPFQSEEEYVKARKLMAACYDDIVEGQGTSS